MESSREAILRAVRSRQPKSVASPDSFRQGIVYGDRVQQFHEALTTVGGKLIATDSPTAAGEQLRTLPAFAGAKQICSLFPEILPGNVPLDEVGDPHALEPVDLAILPGELAVAENAAIWFRGDRLRHRVLPFIVQHLVLVVPAANFVSNMHEAYERLEFTKAGFGVFISGPSKTADIEQSLVIGAHGPRSLMVVLLST